MAPSYNSLWTGSGATLSSDCWDFTLTSHQHLYFGIIDTFQLRVAASLKGPCAETALALLEDGCSVSGISVASGITPATFQVGYTNDWAAA